MLGAGTPFTPYYFAAQAIRHPHCLVIYCRDNVDGSDMEDRHCGLETKPPGRRFSDGNIIFLSLLSASSVLGFDLGWGVRPGKLSPKVSLSLEWGHLPHTWGCQAWHPWDLAVPPEGSVLMLHGAIPWWQERGCASLCWSKSEIVLPGSAQVK